MTIVFLSFVIILVLTYWQRGQQWLFNSRSEDEWLLDMSGLLLQGVLIPFLQTVALYYLFSLIVPDWNRSISLHPVAGFLTSFVLVDYLYYWNHRILHKRVLWPFHRVHHSSEKMDLLVTSRNSLLSPFLLVYLWMNGLFVFVLQDPTCFIIGMSLTAALDIWRHSGFELEPRFLSHVLVMPRHHAWHHSHNRAHTNFGANFVLWDRIHGTYYGQDGYPEKLGIPVRLSVVRKIFFPYAPGNGK